MAKIGGEMLLLQGDEVVVCYLRTSTTCRGAFRVRETKLVYTCNGSPWFPSSRPFAMAAEEKVTSTLNRLVDRAFLDVLSPRD